MRSASSTFAISMMRMLNEEVSMPFRLPRGISMVSMPSFSASRMRCSMRPTGLISPESPTSPVMHVVWGIGMSMLLESMELITARSSAGSLTFRPPAMLRNTSLAASLNPARFSRTARSMFMRLESNPLTDRWGVP